MRNLKRALSLALASVMLLGMMVVGTGASYADVTSKNNQEAIEVLQAVGVMSGDDKGNFNPDQKVTRGEMAVVMANLLNLKVKDFVNAKTPFTDVPAWANGYVAACYADGITAGISATEFGFNYEVTTAQAALMMMKALGYFQNAKDFGSDWQVATVKQGSKIDLFNGVAAGASTAMTRNDVAQIALNTLEATMVETDGTNTTITAGDITINTGDTKYVEVEKAGSAYTKISGETYSSTAKYTVQLGEQLFDGKLEKTTLPDSFKRPGTTWKYENKKVAFGSESALVTYTAETKATAVKSDLEDYTYASGLKASVNSDTGASVASYNDVAALTADGSIVEVYAKDSTITNVVVIKTDYAKVTAVNDTKKTFTISYNTNKTLVINEDSDFYGLYKAVKKDDILVVSYASDSTVLALHVPTKVTGEITYVKSDNTQATVAGQTVKAAATAGTLFSGKLGQDSVVYLNASGYAVYVDAATTSSANYIYVTNMWKDTADKSYGQNGEVTYYVRGVKVDGTIVNIKIANNQKPNNETTAVSNYADFGFKSEVKYVGNGSTDAGDAVNFDDGTKPNTVYQYTESTKDAGLYLLTVPATGNASTTEGTVSVTGGSNTNLSSSASSISNIYMSSNVSFVWVSGNGDDVKASVTGKAAIGKNINYTGIVEKDTNTRNLITVVFVSTSSVTSEDVIYVSDVLGSVKFKDADGKSQTGTQVKYYAYGSTSASTMIVSGTVNSNNIGKFYTTETNGEAYKLIAATDNRKENASISSMYNGYAKVTEEYNLNNATIIDVADKGINSVAALENAVNTAKQTVKVSFIYSGSDNKVETVYVQSVKSTDAAIDSVTVNGAAATLESSATATHALTIAKDTVLTLVVNLSDSNATYEVTYDNDGNTYDTFTNGVSKTAGTAEKTGYFKIVVTAEDGTTSGTYYVAFKTPADN